MIVLILWTIQPQIVYNELIEKGIFKSKWRFSNCNYGIHGIDETFDRCYKWLIEKLKDKIGFPDEDLELPIWAYHTINNSRKRPDMRFHGINVRKPYVLLELDVPDNEVVLLDSDDWTCILNDFPLVYCHNEYEYDVIHEWLDNLPQDEYNKFKIDSWDKVFDMTILENADKDWISTHRDIEAVFWAIKKEYIKKVWKYKEHNV